MLAKRLTRLSSTAARPQLYLTHPNNSRMTALPSSSIVSPIRSRNAATTAVADHKGSDGGHHDDHGHGSHYDPPSGWLWGIRPGDKYEKEGWENLFFYGFYGSFIIAGIAYAFKEDTSIQTWALEEARRRLEKEGILDDPSPGAK